MFFLIYWSVIGLHFLAQLLSYWLLPYSTGESFFYYRVLLVPTLIMGGCVAMAQYVHRKAPKYAFYALFIAGTVLSLVIIHLNMDIRIIGALMLLPIMASAMFFRIRLTLTTAALQIAGFCLLYRFDYWFRYYLSPFDVIAVVIFLVVGTLVAGVIITSGRELLNDLESMMTARQQLMVENIWMAKQSRTDALTGMYNHISFHEFYEKALELTDPAFPFHLALIDIDNFKSINDTYGHRIGDLVLARVADVVRSHLSADDIASRYGGEEFAVLLFEQSFESAYERLERIRTELANTAHEELGGKTVTVSIGLKSYTAGATKVGLFEEADNFLYVAKRSGKNRTVTDIHPGLPAHNDS